MNRRWRRPSSIGWETGRWRPSSPARLSRSGQQAERLAVAFGTLVPENERKERLLDLAKDAATQTPLGSESGFEELWQGAADLLMSLLGQDVRHGGVRPRAVRRTHPGDRSRTCLRRSTRTHAGMARERQR